MTTRKGPYSTTKISLAFDADMKCCLLFAHAVSGCDTISATHGVGKIKAYNVLLCSKILQKSMSIVGKGDIDMEDVMKLDEMFFMQLYGKAGNHADSLDDLREILYMLPKYIPIQCMPPTSRTFHFLMLRVHLQVNAWMYLQCTLDPLKYGFKKDENDCFKPIITDKEVAPQDLLKNLKCSCRIQNRSGELCVGCSCAKNGLSCTFLCVCICEGACDNS